MVNTAPKTITLTLTIEQVELLKQGLDSHRYWQLSDEEYRSGGFVREPGSDDEERAEEIAAVDALEHELDHAIEAVSPPKPETPSPEYLASIGATAPAKKISKEKKKTKKK